MFTSQEVEGKGKGKREGDVTGDDLEKHPYKIDVYHWVRLHLQLVHLIPLQGMVQ